MRMEHQIRRGIRNTHKIFVTSESTARCFGSGMVDVFATPAMVAFMETTAMHSIHPLLHDDFTSVGTEVNIKHLRASAVGHELRCDSVITEVLGNKIIFEVSVWDDDLLVGHGTHTRYIVHREKFMSQL